MAARAFSWTDGTRKRFENAIDSELGRATGPALEVRASATKAGWKEEKEEEAAPARRWCYLGAVRRRVHRHASLALGQGMEGSAVGLFSYDHLQRSALLVCDECERVRLKDGRLSERRLRDSSPDELVPHFGAREEITRPAIQAGWTASSGLGDARARWTCPECARRDSSSRPAPPAEPPKAT